MTFVCISLPKKKDYSIDFLKETKKGKNQDGNFKANLI
jgi:hypothetical protein